MATCMTHRADMVEGCGGGGDLFYSALYTENPSGDGYTKVADPNAELDQYASYFWVVTTSPPPATCGVVQFQALPATIDDFLAEGALLRLFNGGWQPVPLQMYHDMGYGDYGIGFAQPHAGDPQVAAELYADEGGVEEVWSVNQPLDWGVLGVVANARVGAGSDVTLSVQNGYPTGATVTVNWGDGSPVSPLDPEATSGTLQHKYATKGDYHIVATPSDTSFAVFDQTLAVGPDGGVAPYGYPSTPTSVATGTPLPIVFHVALSSVWPQNPVLDSDTSGFGLTQTITRTGTGVDITITNWGTGTTGNSFIYWPSWTASSSGVTHTAYMQQVNVTI